MRRLICLSLVGFFTAPMVRAQEEAPPVEPAPPQAAAIVVRAENENGVENVQTFAMATDGGNFFTFAPNFGGTMFGGGNPMEASEFLLNDPGVQKELELVDEQRDQIRDMQNSFAQEIKSKLDGAMKSGTDHNRIPEIIEDINKRKKERLAEILLPHQVDRLRQISLQSNVNNAGLGQALASKALMEQLGIDDAQKEKLKTKAEELAKELEEKVAKLRQEMREELMDELTPDQQKKLKELLGNQFEFETRSGPMMLGPRPPRGGIRQSPTTDN